MAFLVEDIPLLLLKCFAPMLGIALAACAFLLLVHCWGACGNRLRRGFAGQEHVPPAQWVALSVVMAVCTLFSGKNTNGVKNVGMGNLFLFNPPPAQPVTPQDISNGWRVAEEAEPEAFSPPSPGAVTNELWQLRGAHDDAFRILANGWSYPYSTGVTVLSRGELRTGIRTHDFPPAFGQDISLLPIVNWPMLPEGRRESVFWHGATPSNTLLATWRNAAFARDETNPVSFQMELFPDGGFTYRYEDRTVHYVRVWPFDWDDDGLENSVDPDPLVAGLDAHGTNAEWYNTVCSNVLEAVATSCDPPDHGPGGVPDPAAGGTQLVTSVELSWREGVNSNAYYFVDVVTEHGPAPIRFTGDRTSRLGDPVVVALAGETNRVPLIIGIDYAVTSTVPFTVSFPVDYMYPDVETNESCVARIYWPLDFEFTENLTSSNRMYAVDVVPYDPGGTFSWETAGGSSPGGLRGGGCNCVSYTGRSVVFDCSVECECGGSCAAIGTYSFECVAFPVTGGVCRCGFDDPEYHPEMSPPSPDTPSFSVSFSKDVVIFEDAYTDTPGEWNQKRSTRILVDVSVAGGPNGGTFSITAPNLGKLVPVACGPMVIPSSMNLAPYETYCASFVCEGVEASNEGDDVTIAGIFTENVTGQHIPSSDSMTVIRVELTPWVTAPENSSVHRHLLGVGEIVNCLQCPSSPSVTWQSVSGWTVSNSLGVTVFTAPLLADENGIFATCGGQTYSPRIRVIEPEGIVAENAAEVRYGVQKGEAGGIGMKLDLYVVPRTVSFSNIAMQETPCRTGTHSGYFDNPEFADEWYHWTNQGAGEWHNIGADNFFFEDYPRVHGAWPRMMDDGTITTNKSYGWQDGTMVWDIPIGWGPKGTTDNSGQVGVIEGYKQEFVIFSDGFAGVRKFSNRVTRRTNDVVYLNGVLKP